MSLQSNIFNITKVRNGVDANSRRTTTNVETIYKFPSEYTEPQAGETLGLITYTLSPDVLIIGVIDTATKQVIDISNATIEITFSQLNLKELIGATYYDVYFNKKQTSTSEDDDFHWYFHIQSFYDDLYAGELINLSEEAKEIIRSFFEAQDPTDIGFDIITNDALLYRSIPLQIGTNLDIATLSIDAARGIFAAMQGAGLEFTSNGLAITNGNFLITNSNNEAVLNFNKDDGTLAVTGQINATSGYFSGELRAATGTFLGEITATTGMIGGFNIGANTIYSDDLILSSATPVTESSIYVKNITLGTGAIIDKYLKIGNLSLLNPQSKDEYINYDNSVVKLVQPHSQVTDDTVPISGKNYYILSDDEYVLFTGDAFESGIIYYEDGIYFQLTNEGFINGNNWSIKKEPGNDYVTARFGKLIAEDGEFNGVIHARDGVFTGEVLSSIITASTINTANFVTEKTRSMGGAFIFKPTFEIQDIEDDENETYTLLFTLTQNALEYFSLEGSYDKIIAISGTDVRFGKLNSIDSQSNQVGVTFTETDYTILSASGALDNYQTLTLFGQAQNDVLIGINSDNTSAGDILAPRALSIETFTNLQTAQSGVGDIDYNLKLLLGDLSVLNNDYLTGYGLYSDNVYLRGSLITEDSAGSYAGIHTFKDVDFSYQAWGGNRTDIYSNEKIIFWGGANSLSLLDIQHSPFIVTDRGSIFASRGEFKGTVIADSIITDAIIKTPVIYGSGKNPSLKIYDTDSTNTGIGFYKQVDDLDLESNESNDILTLNISNLGFTHYQGSNSLKFIDFNESNNNIYFYGTSYNTETTILSSRQIKDQTGSNTAAIINIIGSSSSNGSEIPGNIELNYASHGVKVTNTNVLNFGGQVINEGEVIFQTASGTRQLDYKTNSSGYYCLYVS